MPISFIIAFDNHMIEILIGRVIGDEWIPIGGLQYEFLILMFQTFGKE